MTIFNSLFYSVFKHYKEAKNKKANRIATFYISVLQCALLFLFGVFFAGFFSQMHMDTMSQEKAWTLFALASIVIFFKNWIQYGGRKRKVLNAKMLKKKASHFNIYLLWLLPIASIFLAIIILQAV